MTEVDVRIPLLVTCPSAAFKKLATLKVRPESIETSAALVNVVMPVKSPPMTLTVPPLLLPSVPFAVVFPVIVSVLVFVVAPFRAPAILAMPALLRPPFIVPVDVSVAPTRLSNGDVVVGHCCCCASRKSATIGN